jgi:hypothetical protein
LVQFVAFSRGWYVPEGQVRHEVWPDEGWYVGDSHGEQASDGSDPTDLK